MTGGLNAVLFAIQHIQLLTTKLQIKRSGDMLGMPSPQLKANVINHLSQIRDRGVLVNFQFFIIINPGMNPEVSIFETEIAQMIKGLIGNARTWRSAGRRSTEDARVGLRTPAADRIKLLDLFSCLVRARDSRPRRL